jgi:hypothetical protein
MTDPNRFATPAANGAPNQNVADIPVAISALFPNRECAEKAHESLIRRGYTENEISVAMRHEGEATAVPLAKSDAGDEVGGKAVENSAKGAAIGGTAGALIGIAAAAGSVLIPGLGIVLAGPIAAGIAGLAAGGVAGGVAGALVGSGVPEEDARGMEEELTGGRILIAVRAHSRAESLTIREEWAGMSAERIREHVTPRGPEGV